MPEYLSEEEFMGGSGQSAVKPLSDEEFLGIKPKRTVLGTVADTGVTLAKGVVGLGEAAVGAANLATFGGAGKVMDAVGYDPKKTQDTLSSLYSPAQQSANKEVDQAKGFVDTGKAMLENPSTIYHGIVETAPAMLGGAAVARGALQGLGKVAPKLMKSAGAVKWAPVVAGSAGEGIVAGGQQAEQIRQETPDKSISMKQAGLAGLSGIGTAAFGFAGGSLAKRLGFTDIDTFLATGATGTAKKEGFKGLVKKIVGGGISEGVFEEMPQTAQETILYNAAMDKPLMEGVPEGLAKAGILGGVMGGGANLLPSGQRAAAVDPGNVDPAQAGSQPPPPPASTLPIPRGLGNPQSTSPPFLQNGLAAAAPTGQIGRALGTVADTLPIPRGFDAPPAPGASATQQLGNPAAPTTSSTSNTPRPARPTFDTTVPIGQGVNLTYIIADYGPTVAKAIQQARKAGQPISIDQAKAIAPEMDAADKAQRETDTALIETGDLMNDFADSAQEAQLGEDVKYRRNKFERLKAGQTQQGEGVGDDSIQQTGNQDLEPGGISATPEAPNVAGSNVVETRPTGAGRKTDSGSDAAQRSVADQGASLVAPDQMGEGIDLAREETASNQTPVTPENETPIPRSVPILDLKAQHGRKVGNEIAKARNSNTDISLPEAYRRAGEEMPIGNPMVEKVQAKREQFAGEYDTGKAPESTPSASTVIPSSGNGDTASAPQGVTSSQDDQDRQALSIIRNPKYTTQPTEEQRPIFRELARKGYASSADGLTYTITKKGARRLRRLGDVPEANVVQPIAKDELKVEPNSGQIPGQTVEQITPAISKTDVNTSGYEAQKQTYKPTKGGTNNATVINSGAENNGADPNVTPELPTLAPNISDDKKAINTTAPNISTEKEPWQMGQKEYVSWAADGKDPDSNIDSRTPTTIRENAATQHRKKIYRALREGKPVPPEALADYPDLQPPTLPAGQRTQETTEELIAPGARQETSAISQQPVSAGGAQAEKPAKKPGQIHDYSNTQVNIKGRAARKIRSFGKSIPDAELYTDPNDDSYGREKEPHITVRYGLDTDDPAKLAELSKLGPITAKIGKVSIFETDKYDVVKAEIESDSMRAASRKVGELVAVPGETFKDYQPHATIAYVKKGEGKKYVGDKSLEGTEITFDEINLTDRIGMSHSIKLSGQPSSPAVPESKETPAQEVSGGKGEPTGKYQGFSFSAEEIPYQAAYDAYRGSSFSPDKRAKQVQEGYVSHMQEVVDTLSKLAKTDEQKADLRSWFNDYYKPKYVTLLKSKLSADSRTMSSMITGPANFPTRGNQKKLDTADKRSKELYEWADSAYSKMKRKLSGREGISSTDPEALAKLKEKLATLESSHETMKEANKIIKNKKLSEAEKIAALVAMKFTEKQAKEILQPDFAGRIGLAPYVFQNSNANIKTVKDRIAALEQRAEKAEETGGSETREFDGGSVELNYGDGYVRIFHDDKPSADVRQQLKSNGFRWSPADSAWRRKLNNQAQWKAEEITGVKFAKEDLSDLKNSKSLPPPKSSATGKPWKETLESIGMFVDATKQEVVNEAQKYESGKIIPWKLRDSMARRNKNGSVKATGLPETDFAAAERLARIFNKEIVWATIGDQLKINGFIVRNNQKLANQIFIDVRSNLPMHTIFGHELVHHIEQDSPKAFNDLFAVAQRFIKDTDKYAAERSLKGLSERDLQVEILADFMGDNFANPEFWQEVQAQAGETRFRRIARRIMRWIDSLLGKTSGLRRYGSDKFISDVKAARSLMAGFVAGYQSENAGVDGGVGEFEESAAFHGSPHDFDAFRMGKIGTGEGNQAYGSGLYFASKKSVADWYRKSLSESVFETTQGRLGLYEITDELMKEMERDGNLTNISTMNRIANNVIDGVMESGSARKYFKNYDTEIGGAYQRYYESAHKALKRLDPKNSKGKLYEVELAPQEDEYLLWDKPLSEQPEKVKEAWKNLDYKGLGLAVEKGPDGKYELVDSKGLARSGSYESEDELLDWWYVRPTGGRFYENVLSSILGSDSKASEYLHSLGIRGIKYLDGTSRGKGDGNFNYVIFDENDISITAKYSVAGMSEAFRAWFGKSVVSKTVFHGSPTFGQGNNFTFDVNRVSGKTSSPGRGLGTFFTEDRNESLSYAGASGESLPIRLRIENPLEINSYNLPAFKTVEEARAYRKRKELQGYDGIHLKDLDHWVIFEPNQAKSADKNSGEYSRENDDIRYSFSSTAKDMAATYRDLMADESYIRKLPTDSTLLSKIFSSPEYTFKKAAAAWRAIQVQYNRMDAKIKLENDVFNTKVGQDGKKSGFIQTMQEAKKKFKEAYEKANKYLLDTDRTGKAFTLQRKNRWQVTTPEGETVGYGEIKTEAYKMAQERHKLDKKSAYGKMVKDETAKDANFKPPKFSEWDFNGRLINDYKVTEGEWWAVVDKNGKEVSLHENDSDASKDMMDREGDMLRGKGYAEKAVTLVREYREMTGRAFDMMIADLRKIIAEARENGLDEPTVSVVDETKRFAVREDGKTIATFATKKDAMKFGGGKHTVKEQADDEIRKEMKLSEVIAMMSDLRGSYFARQRARGSIVLRAEKDGEKIMKKFDFHMVGDKYIDAETGVEYNRAPLDWMKKAFNFTMSAIPGTLSKEMRLLKRQGYTITSVGKETSMPESVFEAAKLVASISAMLTEAKEKAGKKGVDKTLIEQAHKILMGELSNIIKQRGYMSSRLKRNRDYVSGFEEDMLLSGTQYGRGLAAGIAKKEAARQFIAVVTGTDINFNTWKADRLEEGQTGTYDEWLAFIENRKLDPLKQPALYADVMAWVKEMLRNEEQVDRVMGTLQGLAVIKFLGFRLSSAAVNATNMVQAVPATISSHTGGTISGALREVTRAATAYGKFRTGKDISDSDRAVLMEIVNNGWDEAQFNKDSVEVLQSKLGRGWNTFSEWAMKAFGAVEKTNRAVTILAAYNQFRTNTGLSHDEAMQKAKHASDRAHGVYGKATRPTWTRGAWNPLRLAFTFAKFGQNYAMNMTEMGLKGDHKAAAYMLLSPAVLAGAGASVATPVIVALASALGVGGDDPEEEFYKWAEETFGTDRFTRHGLAGLAGVNLKGSIQMNNPMPTKISELFGAPGALFTDVVKGAESFRKGEVLKGVEAWAPTALGTAVKSVREGTEGITTGSYSPVFYGNEPIKSDGVEASIRFLGFNPARISGIREKQWREKVVAKKFQERRDEINSMIKKTIIYKKGDIMDVYKEIQRYNELVVGSGRRDISLINPARQFRTVVRRAQNPGKVERMRMVDMVE